MKIEKCPFCGCKAILCSTGNHFATEKFFVSCGVCGVETPRIARTRKEAVAAWNRRAQPSEKPLTLDELRQMDGEPVWVMHQDGSGARWGIVQDTEYGLCAVVDDDTAYWFTDVCGTIAYRSKPGEATNER